jgi:hypothetical protein
MTLPEKHHNAVPSSHTYFTIEKICEEELRFRETRKPEKFGLQIKQR